MPYTLAIENVRGERLDISEDQYLEVHTIDGLQPADATLNTSSLVNLDGAVFNSIYVNQKQIIITGTFAYDAEATRIRLYRYAAPKKKVRLYYKNSSRDVYIDGWVVSCVVDPFSMKQTFQITIGCPDPFFSDIDNIIEEMRLLKSDFHYTFFNPEGSTFTFGHYEELIEQNIVNMGDVDIGMLITLEARGTVKNPTIYNKDTRESMTVNITMQAGDVIKIYTVEGDNKYVTLIRNAVETNIFNLLEIPVGQENWLLLYVGDNILTYDAEDGAGDLYISFDKRYKYSGV